MVKYLGTHRFQRAGGGGISVGGLGRDQGRMRAIASENHSTQARRLPDVWFWINTPFPKPARWKRCVPRAPAPKFGAPSPTRKF